MIVRAGTKVAESKRQLSQHVIMIEPNWRIYAPRSHTYDMAMLSRLRKNPAIASQQCGLGANHGGEKVPKKITLISRVIIRNNIFEIL